MKADLEISLPNYGTGSHPSEEIIPKAEPIATCWGNIRVLSVAIVLYDIFHFYQMKYTTFHLSSHVAYFIW